MDNKKVSMLVPGSPLGMTTPDRLETIAEIARKYNVEKIKITSAQRIKFLDLDSESVPAALEELGGKTPPKVKKGVHTVQACPGTMTCKFARMDTLDFAEQLTLALSSFTLPGKVKVGISGCGFNCCEGYVRDIGFFAKKSGWTLVFGGNAAGRPRIGDVIGEGLTDGEAVILAEKCLRYYADNAKKAERSARLITRKGLDDLKEFLFVETSPMTATVNEVEELVN
ncbi:MAG: NAD(P)/FAD-dependent oxidoreductase [Desulfobacteraceae bacterium]|nr:NAD(P)/FAD-dependent oxidoreductase [Desulfobacteraceae bacterium]